MFLQTKYFIAVEGFNPRIHALYFCPQLFRYDDGDRLVPLEGEEIGQLIARAVEAGAAERRPWYEPTDKLPQEPLIKSAMLGEFDTLVVELPLKRESLPAAGQQPAPLIRLTLEPKAAPVPALKYYLLPQVRDRKRGNAATLTTPPTRRPPPAAREPRPGRAPW